MTLLVLLLIMHIQDLAGVAHDDIDPSVFSIRGDEQIVSIVVRYKVSSSIICSKHHLLLYSP